MNAVLPSRVLRLGRLLRPGRNPLARGVDRAESTAVILFVLFALALVPVMLTFGSLTYASLAEQGEQQARARHETVAVLTEDAPVTSVGAPGEAVDGKSMAAARWQLPDGTTRAGRVDADDGAKAGAEVSVWLDEAGDPVDPPLSAVDSIAAGVLVALFGWFTAVGLIALACWGLHHLFDRQRYRTWDAEWARVEPDWHQRSH